MKKIFEIFEPEDRSICELDVEQALHRCFDNVWKVRQIKPFVVMTAEAIEEILWNYLSTVTILGEGEPNKPYQVIFKRYIPEIAQALLSKILKQEKSYPIHDKPKQYDNSNTLKNCLDYCCHRLRRHPEAGLHRTGCTLEEVDELRKSLPCPLHDKPMPEMPTMSIKEPEIKPIEKLSDNWITYDQRIKEITLRLDEVIDKINLLEAEK